MDYEISPEPDAAERAAIVAALGADDEEPQPSPWAQSVLPERFGEGDEPYPQ